MKLLSIEKSSDPKKKYMAIMCDCEGCSKCSPVQRRVVHFGAYGYEDYISYFKKSPELAEKRKALYIERHEKNEDWTDHHTPGALSRYILWNKPTLSESVADYKKRFNL